MSDFICALGLVLVIEGVLSAAFPNLMRAVMLAAAETPAPKLRLVGIVSAIIGIGVVWLIRK